MDLNTMTIRESALPATNARPRRIALAPDGTIYYTVLPAGISDTSMRQAES
jgi:hypothetical protein